MSERRKQSQKIFTNNSKKPWQSSPKPPQPPPPPQNSKLELKNKFKDYLISDVPNQSKFEEEIDGGFQDIKQYDEKNSYNYAQGEEFKKLKEQGNSIYKKVNPNDIPLSKIEAQLNESKQYYFTASLKAQTSEEKAQIFKNLAVVNFKILQCLSSDYKSQSLFKEGLQYVKSSISFMLLTPNRNKEWFTKLIDTQNEALKFVLNKILNEKDTNQNLDWAISQLQSFALEVKLEFDREIYLIIKKKQVEVMEEQILQFKFCDKFIHAETLQMKLNNEINKLYLESKKLRKERIKFFFEERYNQICSSIEEYQSYKYLALGNQIYRQVQNERLYKSSFKIEESDQIWESVDAYKAAIKLFEGKFLNIEAESYFMLGQIYMELLGRQNQKVHDYIRNSITLDFNSSNVTFREWYIQAQNIMKILQSEAFEAEQAQFYLWKSNNSNLVAEIELQKAKGEVEFIKWITKEHLPSNKQSFSYKEEDYWNHKKILKKAMLLYHGDKIINESQHFKFIAKEIMNILTEFYEAIK